MKTACATAHSWRNVHVAVAVTEVGCCNYNYYIAVKAIDVQEGYKVLSKQYKVVGTYLDNYSPTIMCRT